MRLSVALLAAAMLATLQGAEIAVSGTGFTLDGKPFPYTGVSFFNAIYNAEFNRSSEIRKAWIDKFQRYGVAATDGPATGLPLLHGCVAWLECALLSEPHNQGVYDLFLGQVLAARADARVFVGGRWQWAPQHDALRTLHHLGGGSFVSVQDPMQAQVLPGPPG